MGCVKVNLFYIIIPAPTRFFGGFINQNHTAGGVDIATNILLIPVASDNTHNYSTHLQGRWQ